MEQMVYICKTLPFAYFHRWQALHQQREPEQQVGFTKIEDLVFVHSNLRLASHKGPEYNSGNSKEWDVDPECLDLEISFTFLNVNEEPRSGIGLPSSTTPSETQHASCSKFQEDYDDEAELEDYQSLVLHFLLESLFLCCIVLPASYIEVDFGYICTSLIYKGCFWKYMYQPHWSC